MKKGPKGGEREYEGIKEEGGHKASYAYVCQILLTYCQPDPSTTSKNQVDFLFPNFVEGPVQCTQCGIGLRCPKAPPPHTGVKGGNTLLINVKN